MKTMNFMKGMAFAAMIMMGLNATAQRTNNLVVSEHGIRVSVGKDKKVEHREVVSRDMDENRRYERTNNYHNDKAYHNDKRRPGSNKGFSAHVEVYEGRGHAVNPYEGRVRHMGDGRWGYLRGKRWYYYDCYYEPDYYFSHPASHFHSHIVKHVGKAVVATAAIATLVSILTH